MEIEFDGGKSERNRRERGFGFGYAARIFLDRILLSLARAENGEIRMKAIGRVDDLCFVVIFFDDGDI